MEREHRLKTWPLYFAEVLSGHKTFEIRKNDRVFLTGDVLVLDEFNPDTGKFTGRECSRRVVYLTDFQQKPGYVVLGIAPMERDERTAPAPAPPRKCYICGSYHAAMDGCPPVRPAEPEQPPVTVQPCRVDPGRVRAIARYCAENMRSDFASNLYDIADYLERRQ